MIDDHVRILHVFVVFILFLFSRGVGFLPNKFIDARDRDSITIRVDRRGGSWGNDDSDRCHLADSFGGVMPRAQLKMIGNVV